LLRNRSLRLCNFHGPYIRVRINAMYPHQAQCLKISRENYPSLPTLISFIGMSFIDTLNFCLSLFGLYSLVLYLRYLLPCCKIPPLSTFLNETQQLLDHAEAIGAIPPDSEDRAHLSLLANQFAMMRIESNRAQGIFRQLHVVILRGLTCRLYSFQYRIEATKLKLELAVDEHQTTSTVIPKPAAVTATPLNNVHNATLPLPATTS